MKERKRRMKKLVVALGFSLAVVGAAAGPAFAGERGGNGEETPINDHRARSECAFSGLDDFDFEAPVDPGVVQSFGQIVSQAGPLGGVPGRACNGHLNPQK
jgi:hypothetical protein